MKKVSIISMAALGALIGSTQGFANDHAEIEGPFETPMEVTATCLECHEDAAKEVMATTHWTWEKGQDVPGKGTVARGKKNAINNFCVSVGSNEPRCTSCHVGYGWKDGNFDFSDESRVDCLVCHDTTGTYKKPGAGAGMPAGFTGNAKMDKKPVDLVKVAQNAGMPTRDNCITCHAFGGGGNNVKPGDMSNAMRKPGKDLDVHMDAKGLNFSCQQCHKTDMHNFPGQSLLVSPGTTETVACTDCHGDSPHRYFPTAAKYNKHAEKIACQTCHIAHFAKADGTKMSWDWSKAATSKAEAKEKKIVKEHGHKTYIFKKGLFTYEDNVVPTYAWYNGTAGAYMIGDKIDPSKVTVLNQPQGSKDDESAKIMPFKVHTGKQIYDTKFNYLITPKVWGPKGDPDAFWVQFDWKKAAAAGMKISGLEFSGEYGFAPTASYWPINHQVDPKSKALKCLDCHKEGKRMDWKALGYAGDPMAKK
jgi:octaheme c-type cytochrome (tetrathionate reductase family)